MIVFESNFGAQVCHRQPTGLRYYFELLVAEKHKSLEILKATMLSFKKTEPFIVVSFPLLETRPGIVKDQQYP